MPIETAEARRGVVALGAASLLCLVLGSVHAFSMFLEPLEARFAASRSMVSLTYSLALVSLTVAVLIGHHVFTRVSAGRLVIGVCTIAAIGALIAARAASLVEVWIGYSLLFGGANGLGYAFGLQSAALANPGREGMSMGVVTAAYAAGAALSPVLFAQTLAWGGFPASMAALGMVLAIIAPVCAVAMASAAVTFNAPRTGSATSIPPATLVLLWICYGAGVAAGLMAIGHAAGIASAAGWSGASWITPALIALFNMLGSFAGGWLADRIRPLTLLIGLPLVSAASLLAIAAVSDSSPLTLAGLCVVGLSYGGTIAVFPATVAKLFGTMQGARVYGKVFTAWGTAGLVAPWFAGYLYDRTSGYVVALICAAVLSLASALAARRLLRASTTKADTLSSAL